MEEQLRTVLELCHEPMLALDGSIVAYLNPAAEMQFPELKAGSAVGGFLPEHILLSDAEHFVASAVVRDKSYTVSARRVGALLLLSLLPAPEPDTGLLSDGILVGMRSALFNIGLSSRRVAAQEALTPETRRYLALLQHNYHQMLRQLSNLSLATTLQEKTAFLRISRIELTEFCRELVSAVSGLDPESLASVEFTTPLSSLYASVDAEKLERLLLNLLSNSLRACAGGGTIHLRLTKRGASAVLSVDDNGTGIAPEILQNVFSRYSSRLTPDLLSQPVSGGLGLTVAKGIAELHGGALVIESRPGVGTSVRAMLPLEQSKSELLEDNHTAWHYSGPDLLLTELADVLPASCYTGEFFSE